jgi:hypothetical protein
LTGISNTRKNQKKEKLKKHSPISDPPCMSFEVKADSMSLKTGNFFIETDNKKGYSGISITDAEYHIICDTVDYYLLPTFQIKELLASGQYSKRYVKDGTCGRIIPCNDIIKLSIKLN